MSVSLQPSTTATFRVFKSFDEVGSAVAGPPVHELYTLLERVREAVRTRQPGWAAYPTLTRYADVCFWAMRKLEYSFAVNAVSRIAEASDSPLHVLDVGCGVVPLCNWISQRGHTVTALDPSRADIGFLVRNDLNAFYGSQVSYRVGQAERLDFPDETFEVVTCVSVLEHLPPGNDRVAVSEMARVLKPGGHLILTFDVSPPPMPQDGEGPWPPDWRRHSRPFFAAAAKRLLDDVGPSFESWPPGLIDELARLGWDDVWAFWRAARQDDANREDVRDYLATGIVLERRAGAVRMPADEMVRALLEGQAALEERVEFHQTHALARLRLLQRIDSSGGQRQRLLGRLSSAASPLLGEPRQYAARPMRLPRRYARTKAPTPAPVISVVTPSLNQGQFLEQTILSVVGQGYPRLEYLVQDGGSTDGTPAVLERHRPMLSSLESRPDNGLANALNLAFSRSTGEIMGWINADDLLLPGALACVARFFVTHPDVEVVYAHRLVIDAAGQEVGRWVLPPGVERVLAWANFVPQETLFWRRSVWERAGASLNEGFDLAPDWELLLRFRERGARFARLPRFLGAMRVHLRRRSTGTLALEPELLRQRALGRCVSASEVDRAIRPYLRRQMLWDRLYRWGVLRY